MNIGGIKNIIFDLGGVLLNLDFNLTKLAFVNLGVAYFDVHYTKARQNGLFDSFEIGQLSEQEFCVELRKLTTISASNYQIIDAWNAMLLNFPMERKLLLFNLKNHFSTSLLSNTNETHINKFTKIIKNDINENSLASLFNSVYYSNEIGLRKPDQKVFEFVLEQNNYLPKETLFLDDSIQHIEGAKKCGIQTIQIQETPIEELFANFLT